MATKIDSFTSKADADAALAAQSINKGDTYVALYTDGDASGAVGAFRPEGFGTPPLETFDHAFPTELDTVPDGLEVSGTTLMLKAGVVSLASVSLTSDSVGLGNVDNTSDADKPISTATQTALNGKASSSHTHSAASIGLGNVDNTSDADKPISSAVQSALSGKASSSHSHSVATQSAAGFMSAADKKKLDGLGGVPDGWTELFGWRYLDTFALDTDYWYYIPGTTVRFGVRRQSNYPTRLYQRIKMSGGVCEYYAKTWNSYGEGAGAPGITETVGSYINSRGIYDTMFYALEDGVLEAEGDLRIQVYNSGGLKFRMLYRP